jgi:hypothetical protein
MNKSVLERFRDANALVRALDDRRIAPFSTVS